MTDEANPLDEILAPLAGAGATPDPAEHPADERLSTYAEGKLAEAEELEVQEHLALCGRCRDLLLELASFVAVPLAAETKGVADLEVAKAWRALQAQMTGEAGEMPETGVPEPGRERRLVRQLRIFQVVAAVLGAAVVGLSLYAPSVPGHSEKIVAMPGVTVDFSRPRGRPSSRVPMPVTLPCSLKFFATSLDTSYRLEIVNAGEKVIYSGGPYSRDEFETLTLPLRRDLLRPGTYTIHLYGSQTGHTPEMVGTQLILVKP